MKCHSFNLPIIILTYLTYFSILHNLLFLRLIHTKIGWWEPKKGGCQNRENTQKSKSAMNFKGFLKPESEFCGNLKISKFSDSGPKKLIKILLKIPILRNFFQFIPRGNFNQR